MELQEHLDAIISISSEGHGDSLSFMINHQTIQTPHLIMPNKIEQLDHTTITPSLLEEKIPKQDGLLFVLGTSEPMTNQLRKFWNLWCIERDFYFEWMNYPAACRSISILMEEKRPFACLLIP